MNTLSKARDVALGFVSEEDGSQVVEYGLVIALVSITLALGLRVVAGATPFDGLATRIATCLGLASGTATC